VIAADDNASRYLIQPYYKEAALPVVFCGINHTVEPYGYPYHNATGMIEISPVRPLLKYVRQALPHLKQAVYLAADVPTQHKEFEMNHDIYGAQGIDLVAVFVNNMSEWLAAYTAAQQADLLVLGSNGGIDAWDDARAVQLAVQQGHVLSITNYAWMDRYAMLAITKLAEEQGQWAAQVALAVLDGQSISDIPIVVNRRWSAFVNMKLLKNSGVKLPQAVMVKAKRVFM